MRLPLVMFLILAGASSVNAFAECEAQVRVATINYLVKNLNDNEAGSPGVSAINEIVAGQGDIRNGMAEVSAYYHKKNITSVHDLMDISLTALYHAPTCTILDIAEQ